ncbi:MAG: hypothetical protein GTO02_00365 [Candidatus Dadabacteria bacterium]|nr:hypothetical protein [Candidatus Dadabacteria bacterium]
MSTPILFLILLISPYFVVNTFTKDKGKLKFAGVVGFSLVFMVAGVGHFIKTEEMMLMLPTWLPLLKVGVILTGILEIVLAIAILKKDYRKILGVFIIFLMLIFLMVNINAAYYKVPFGGHELGLRYLLIRVPLQFVFIIWVYYFCVKNSVNK